MAHKLAWHPVWVAMVGLMLKIEKGMAKTFYQLDHFF
jgi:hypothetical protein